MKSSLAVRVVLLTRLGIIFFQAPSAHAQNADNIRVARLSLAEGQVLVSHAGSDIWEEAPPNLPLQEGDSVATQGGLAEIEFENGATAYLAENSILQFTRLGFSGGGRATELTLTQGSGTFYANLTSQDSFRVHALTFDVAIPERAEFRVDGFLDGAAVQVFLGDVSVSNAKESTNLEKGQSVAVHQKNLQDLSVGSLPTAEDAFDQWVTKQGGMIRAGNKDTLNYINSPNYYGLSDLSRYGTWVNIADFGYSWRPFSVGFTWTPYFNGRWVLNPLLGWIWVSEEPWGWMPYHFGSWLLSPNLGWVWVPGSPAGLRQWQPARVDWVRAGNQVGWVAMSPNDRDGVPANAAHVITARTDRTAGNANGSNEIVSGKQLQSVTQLKQPPVEFASQQAPRAPHSGIQSTIRIAPWTLDNNPSIVFDHGARTFVNRDGGNQNNGDQPGKGSNAPVAPAALMPPPNTRTQAPRVTLPPPVPADSQTNRVLLPRPFPVPLPPSTNIPSNGISPVRPPMIVPPGTQPRPVAPSPAMPRPAAPAPAPAQIPAPHAAPAQPGSAAQPATQKPQTGSTDRH